MSKRTTFITFVIFMTIAILNMSTGCSEEESTDAIVASDVPERPALAVRVLPGFIQDIFTAFERDGYAYSPEHVGTVTFTSWPEEMSDSVYGTITYYPMEYVADSEAKVAYIEYVQTDVVNWVQPFIVSFVEPPEGERYTFLAEGIWVKSFLATRTDGGAHESLEMAASTTGFGACWLSGSVAGCIGGGIACIASGPAWPACAGLSCAGSILGSEIGCAIASWLS